jgi:hypothetical protein
MKDIFAGIAGLFVIAVGLFGSLAWGVVTTLIFLYVIDWIGWAPWQ